MTEDEWKKELKKYRSTKRVTVECLEGLSDHLRPCRTGQTNTLYERSQYTGIVPVEHAAVCSRGTRGCNLEHNDFMALKFAMMGFKRLKELQLD